MTQRDAKTMSGSIFDEATEIGIVELRAVCSIETELIEEMIDEGILEPIGGHREQRRFSYNNVRRTRIAIRLQRDLGLNLAGAALALELLERIEDLTGQLRRR